MVLKRSLHEEPYHMTQMLSITGQVFHLSGDPQQSAVHAQQLAGRRQEQRGDPPPRRSRETSGVFQSSTAPSAAGRAGTSHQGAGLTAAGDM